MGDFLCLQQQIPPVLFLISLRLSHTEGIGKIHVTFMLFLKCTPSKIRDEKRDIRTISLCFINLLGSVDRLGKVNIAPVSCTVLIPIQQMAV